MVRSLNWSGIAFGAGTGLVVGLILSLIVGGGEGPAAVLVLIQILAFTVAGYIAGRFSLTNAIAAGGFAGLLLFFLLATVAILADTDLNGISFVLFGLIALLLGSAGAATAEAFRRRR